MSFVTAVDLSIVEVRVRGYVSICYFGQSKVQQPKFRHGVENLHVTLQASLVLISSL